MGGWVGGDVEDAGPAAEYGGDDVGLAGPADAAHVEDDGAALWVTVLRVVVHVRHSSVGKLGSMDRVEACRRQDRPYTPTG
ncbi:hypothetical protein OG203_02650 [Nocardia sp. NBC_01499]